jgi:alpha-L-fucosidase
MFQSLLIHIPSLLVAVACALGPLSSFASAQASFVSTQERAELPDSRLDWWREARFGMFIHWGLYAIPAGEWKGSTGHAEWIRTTAQVPRETYAEFLPRFNPVEYDAEAWVLAAKRAGMKYIVITSKHHDGFCLFDSKQTDWDVMASPYGKDLLAPLAEACRKHGLKICWYHSIMDWHHSDYLPRRGWEDWSSEGADLDRYLEYLHAQVTELLTNYGDIGVMWFDGEWERTWNHEYGQALYDLCRELQPDVIVNNRVDVGRGGMAGMTTEGGYAGDFGTPEQEIPATGLPGVDWETCMTMNRHWGYNAADNSWKSNEDLIHKLIDIASKGGNFLLNVGPTAEGRFPAPALERLEAMGDWLDVNGEGIYGTSASPFEELSFGRATSRDEGGKTTLYLFVFDWPEDGTLDVVGLGTVPNSVRQLTAEGDLPLGLWTIQGGVELQLDATRRDPVATTLALEFDDTPVIYRTPAIEAAADLFVRPMTVSIDARSPGLEVRYTLDGSTPKADSTLYTAPLILEQSVQLRVRSFHGGKGASRVVARDFTRVEPKAALADVEGIASGLKLEVISGDFDMLPGRDTAAEYSEVVQDLDLGPAEEYVARRYVGYLLVKVDDAYTFNLTSDDGSRLFIGEELIIDNDGLHGPKTLSGVAALAAGWHPIRVEWFNKTGGAALDLMMGAIGEVPQPIARESFSHR